MRPAPTANSELIAPELPFVVFVDVAVPENEMWIVEDGEKKVYPLERPMMKGSETLKRISTQFADEYLIELKEIDSKAQSIIDRLSDETYMDAYGPEEFVEFAIKVKRLVQDILESNPNQVLNDKQ